MTEFFKPVSKYEMYFVAPYVGSITTLVFIFISIVLILYFDRGWMMVLGAIILLGIWAGIDWNKDHGQKAKQVFYRKDNLVVPKWVYNVNRELAAYCKQNNFQWKHSYYRCWITANGTTWQMYTFPRIPWSKTVIGFEDEKSKQFFLKILSEVYKIEDGNEL